MKTRPQPPEYLGKFDEEGELPKILVPAPELADWVNTTILAEDGPLHNSDYTHLLDADLCFVWASTAFTKKGRTVLGQCEQVMFRAGGWQKARQEREMRKRFVYLPVFIIALAAGSAILTAALWLNLG